MPKPDPRGHGDFKVCVIRSTPEQLSIPKRAICKALEAFNFRKEDRFAIKLALEEALTNALKHGNQNDASKKVVIRYSVSPRHVIICVRDEGCGFEPSCVPDPTTPERLPMPNGRGIMLIKAYMDEVEYSDHGREIRFVKRCACAPPNTS